MINKFMEVKNYNVSEDLFNKIRSKFPSVTLGNEEGIVTSEPKEAKFFDFEYIDNGKALGNISISLSETELSIMYSESFLGEADASSKKQWYNFLKELRVFAKKRLLDFDVRNITKSNLDKRDYNFLANRSKDVNMTESRMYGTNKNSYQDIGSARINIRHAKPINQELAAGRTQFIENIFIENNDGERFKYPFKHINGARAMAMHISEGGSIHDEFGKHIIGLSEELTKLKKYKTYVSRSNVVAEGLAAYTSIVNNRILTVKKTLENLQKQNRYKEILEGFIAEELQEVPTEIAANWIDQLTVKQFNEELQDVFPYIYKLISEKQAEKITPDNIVDEVNDEEVEEAEKEEDTFNEFEEWAENIVDSALSEDDLQPKQKVPVTEFILSMYDRETGQFPKGETAVLTAVEKDYGENLINPAKQFIEAINQKFQEYHGYNADDDGVLMDDDFEEDLIDPKPKSDRRYFVVPNMEDYYDIQNDRRFAGYIEVADENSEVMVLPNSAFHKLKMMYGNKIHEVDPQFTKTYENDVDESGLQYHIGKKKYGKDGMKALAQAGRDGANQEELGKIRDKYIDDSMDILRLAGLR